MYVFNPFTKFSIICSIWHDCKYVIRSKGILFFLQNSFFIKSCFLISSNSFCAASFLSLYPLLFISSKDQKHVGTKCCLPSNSIIPFLLFFTITKSKGIIEFNGRQHFVPTCFWSLEEINKEGYKDKNEAAQKEFEAI